MKRYTDKLSVRHKIKGCETCTGFHCDCEPCEWLLTWPGKSKGKEPPKEWYSGKCPLRAEERRKTR